MEIVHNDNTLRDEILKDAEKKAERILKKAERDVKDIMKKNDEYLENLKKEYEDQYKKDVEEKIKIMNASSGIEIKKMMTMHIGNLVDNVFNIAFEKICNNEIIKFENLFLKLILKGMEKIDSREMLLEINDADLKKVSKEKILKLKYENKKTIKEIEVNDNINGAVLYSSDKKLAVYISIEKYFENFKTQYRTEIYNILTGDNNE